MYQLAISNVVEAFVKFSIKDGDTIKTHSFTLIGDRLTQEEMRAIAADDQTPVKDVLLRHIRGWRGQKLVMVPSDGEGGLTPADFSTAALGVLLSLPGVEVACYFAYARAHTIDDLEAKAKK